MIGVEFAPQARPAPAGGSLRIVDSIGRVLRTGDELLNLDDPIILAHAAARAASNKLADDIVILDVGDLLGVTDHFVLASARNERQLGTVAGEVEGQLKMSGRVPRRREGTKESGWILLDYGDVVVHAFTDEMRAFYELERLWADAPQTAVAADGSFETRPSAVDGEEPTPAGIAER